MVIKRLPAIVNTTSDEATPGDGLCSLREAIIAANAGPGVVNDCGGIAGFDTIKFSVSGTITITDSGFPYAIMKPLTIDGTGQAITIDENGFAAFEIDSGTTVTLSNLTIQGGNRTGGGAILNVGTLTITNCTISGNSAESGGGIANVGTLTVTNSTISGNIGDPDGGGISNAGTLTVTNSTIMDNSAMTDGGGIYDIGTTTVTNSTVSGNSAPAGGGIFGGGTMAVTKSTISGNSAGGGTGGGINNEGSITIINSTVSGNTAKYGGGIGNLGTLNVTSSTIAGNAAFGLAAGILQENSPSATTTVKNSILANGQGGGNCESAGGTFVSDGHNLQDDMTCAFLNVGDQNNTPAGLDPNGLQDNGGPTETIALLPTSTAVDAIPTSPTDYCTEIDGTTPITADQRGEPRPDPEDGPGSCDIGAYELQASASATPTATATATNTATPTSTPTPVAGKLKVSPKRLKFGSVTLNTSVTKTVTVTNAGKIKKKNHPLSILIEMESVDGMPSPSPFSVKTPCDDQNLMPGGKGVPKGETMCTIEVQFEPTEAVSYSGTLTIFDNLEPSEMQTVQLTGKGKASSHK